MCWVQCSLVIAGRFHFPFRVGALDLARVPVCVCVCVCVHAVSQIFYYVWESFLARAMQDIFLHARGNVLIGSPTQR